MQVQLKQRVRDRAVAIALLIAAYVAIAAAMIGANPFRGETVGPFDRLAYFQGWNPGNGRIEFRNPERSDVLDAFLPEWLEARRQLHEGRLPLWNPVRAGGGPALFEPTNHMLTPGFAAFVLAPDPALGFYLSVLCTLVIAGLGMHLLVARSSSGWAALFAGISYMACGFITAWLFWPHTHTAIWIPWLLLAAGIFGTTGSPRALVAVAVTAALTVLGGFPFVVALAFGAAIVHGVSSASGGGAYTALRRGVGVVAGLLLGVALVALPMATLVSFLDSMDLSYRRGGSPLTLARHAELLSMPWAGKQPYVESNMYVGMAAIVFAIVGLVALMRRGRDLPLARTGLVLAMVGCVLAFGLLPREIGAHLPVLSNNPWNRAILLLDIGLILLAATGVDRLMRRLRPYSGMVAGVGVFLCVVQAFDLGHQFRRFNGPTPSEYFYHANSELTALKRTIRPFQYVAQDSSYFLMSGTLGGLGLNEWFAHALRSAQMHNLLDALARNAFSSPTSTGARVGDYRWDEDLTDVVALCYAVYPSEGGGKSVVAISKGSAPVALPPINNQSIVQPVVVDAATALSEIQIQLATYRATRLDGEVSLGVRRPGGGAVVARTTLAAEAIIDNAMTLFAFPDQPTLAAGAYELELLYRPGPKNLNLTAWVLTTAAGSVRRDGASVPGSLNYRVLGPATGALKPIFEGEHVTVAFNEGCVGGAYWTADLTDPLTRRDGGKAELVRYAPENFSLKVTADRPGYLVVPMQYRQGWRASVDGRTAGIDLVKGVLPAVAVPAGQSEVHLVYRPPHWRLGLALSTCAALVLVVLVFARRRRMASQAHEP